MGLLSRFRHSEPVTRVVMLVSVDTEHIAGHSYDLPVEIADRYIVRGYASGDLSRSYDDDELVDLRGNPQVVGL